MLKYIKKIVIPLLLAFTLLTGACNNPSTSLDEGNSGNEGKGRGIHIQNITETNEKIINNGKTEYKILIPTSASENVTIAAEELRLFFEQASGISLSIVTDDAYEPNGKYFSIGKTTLLKDKNLKAEADLGGEGFKIITKDSSIFAYGYKDAGALNGVYELLNLLFNFDVYFADWIVLDEDVTELNLNIYDIKEVPDFSVRILSVSDPIWRRRLRIYNVQHLTTDLRPRDSVDARLHNAILVLEQETYNNPEKPETYHPKWFMDSDIRLHSQTQLCYTAHGDEAEWLLMMEEAVNVIKYAFIDSKLPQEETMYIRFDISDNWRMCKCDGCVAQMDEYGSASGAVVKSCNKISELITAWMNTEEGQPYKRDFQVIFLAYHATVEPPIKIDAATGEEIATIHCLENVIPQFCFNNDPLFSIYEDEAEATRRGVEGWNKCAKHLFSWLYSANYTDYLHMFDDFGEMQELAQYCYDNGISIFYDEATRQLNMQPGFYLFKLYLGAKLAWNVDANVRELTDKYFTNYFGPASDTMREVFNQHRVYNAGLKNSNDINHLGNGSDGDSAWMDMNQTKFWDFRLVKAWYEMCNEAIEKLEKIKNSNAVAYQHYYDHIAAERLSYIYTLVSVFETQFNSSELQRLKLTFRDDVIRLNVSHATHKAMGDINELLQAWGI